MWYPMNWHFRSQWPISPLITFWFCCSSSVSSFSIFKDPIPLLIRMHPQKWTWSLNVFSFMVFAFSPNSHIIGTFSLVIFSGNWSLFPFSERQSYREGREEVENKGGKQGERGKLNGWRERGKEGEKERIFLLLVQSLEGRNGWGFFQVSPVIMGFQSVGTFSITFPGILVRNGIKSRVPGTHTGGHMGCQHHRQWLNTLCHSNSSVRSLR